jgi:prolipoprotein diacylglyceryltransferase
MIALAVVGFIMMKLISLASKQKWAYGIVGIWFLLLYSVFMFVLEFLKDSPVYLGRLTANQWILIGIFAECVGVLYVRGGGREHIRPIANTVRTFIVEKGNKIYAKISRRNTR